jgi:ubiquinone/menaquinone biosynthesis C-methylase UbiE
MNDFDFAVFYDKQPDYVSFRNDKEKQKEYKTLVDWKVRKLTGIIPVNLKFSNILEVGCAFGVLLNSIADRLHIDSRTGIDISGENIKTAGNLYPGCVFFKGTLEDYVKENSYVLKNHRHDLIVLSDIIEHIPDDLEFLKLVRKVSEYVVVNLPLEKSFKNRNRNYGIEDPSGHLRCYDKKLAKKLFSDAGFLMIRNQTSIATSDSEFSRIYKKNRKIRVMSKPLVFRIFWTCFYVFEDKFKLISKRITSRIYGTNYFVFLRSS